MIKGNFFRKLIHLIPSKLAFGIMLFPGIRAANDFPYIFSQELVSRFNLPMSWSSRGSGFGENTIFTLWLWPMDLLMGFLGKIGFQFSFVEFVYLFAIFIGGIFCVNAFLEHLGVTKLTKIIGSAFYLTTTYFLLLVDGGQLSIALAYVFFPLCFVLVDKSFAGDIKDFLKASIAVWLLGAFDIRFIYLLILISLIRFVYLFVQLPNKKKILKNSIVLGLITFIVVVGLNFYWMLPLFVSKSPTLPPTYQNQSQVSFLDFTTYKNAILLLQPHWYKNVFGQIERIRKEFILIPVLVLSSLVFIKKSKNIVFWMGVAFVSVFLTKGAGYPFGDVYVWLFNNLPGFSLFRDSTKFFFLVALSYTALISLSFENFSKRFPKMGKLMFAFVVLFYLSILSFPFWLGKTTGLAVKPIYQDEYIKFSQKIEDDQEFGRIMWIPFKAPLGFSSPVHPSVDGLRIVDARPFATGGVGKYEQFNFLRESEVFGDLLSVLGVKYIAFVYPDARREEIKQDNIDYYYQFFDQLSSKKFVKDKFFDFPILTLELKDPSEKVFITDNVYVVVGSANFYKELEKISNFDLSKNAFVFAENLKDININEITSKGVQVISYLKTEQDLIANSVNGKYISPASQLRHDPDTSNWWKRETYEFKDFRDFMNQKYGIDNTDYDYQSGWAISEGNNNLTVADIKLKENENLFARVMVSTQSGEISFYQDDKLISTIDTKPSKKKEIVTKLSGYKDIPDLYFNYEESEFHWFNVGKLYSSSPLIIKTKGNVNVVNVLKVVDENDLKNIQLNYINWESLSNNQRNDLFAASSSPKLEFKTINTTKYKLSVSQVNKPTAVVLTDVYDSRWRLNDENGFPIYDFANGFIVNKDGQYELNFWPQTYVYYGLAVTGVFATALVAVLFWKFKK